jgi:hypothetical protein
VLPEPFSIPLLLLPPGPAASMTIKARKPLGTIDLLNNDSSFGNAHRAGIDTSNNKQQHKTGRWTQGERFAFLQGLRIHGRGKWKKISRTIPTRYGESNDSFDLKSRDARPVLMFFCLVFSYCTIF